jgi:acyl transferase domain-containing protein
MPLYQAWLNDEPVVDEAQTSDDFLGDLAYTLDTHRSRLPWRWYAVLNSVGGLRDIQSRVSPVSRARAEPPRVGFIFSGQGAQWPGMGRELLSYSSYREELKRAGNYLRSLGCSWSVTGKSWDRTKDPVTVVRGANGSRREEELLKPQGESNVDEAEYSQTLCTVVQVALVNLLRTFGLEPSGTVGHSSGEIAAAYVQPPSPNISP